MATREDELAEGPARGFLEAEQALAELSQALETLRDEAGSYDEAATRLDEAGGALVAASSAFKKLAEQLLEAVPKLDEQGAQVASLLADMKRIEEQLSEHRQATDTAVSQLSAHHASASEALGEAVKQAQDTLAAGQSELVDLLRSAGDAQAAQGAALEARVQSAEASLSGQLDKGLRAQTKATDAVRTDVARALTEAKGEVIAQIRFALFAAVAGCGIGVALLIVLLTR